MTRTLALVCPECGGGRTVWWPQAHAYVACPSCTKGIVRMPTLSAVAGPYLSRARTPQELLVLVGAMERQADAEAERLEYAAAHAEKDAEREQLRELANLSTQAASDFAAVRMALGTMLRQPGPPATY